MGCPFFMHKVDIAAGTWLLPPMAQNPTAANWASIGLLGLVWGGTFMVVSLALRDYGPLTVACARTTLGAAALTLLMRVMGRRFPTGDLQLWSYLAAIGLLSTAMPFFLLSWGQQYVPSAFAGISMAALPLFVLPLAHVFADEPLTLRRSIGVIVGFVGAAVLIGPGVVSATGDRAGLGQLACVGAALSYAVAAILTRRCPPIDPVLLAAASLVVDGRRACLGRPDHWFRDPVSGSFSDRTGCAAAGPCDPQRRSRLHDIGQLSGAALVDGVRGADPVRSLAHALFHSPCADHDGAGCQPVGQPDAAFRARLITG